MKNRTVTASARVLAAGLLLASPVLAAQAVYEVPAVGLSPAGFGLREIFSIAWLGAGKAVVAGKMGSDVVAVRGVDLATSTVVTLKEMDALVSHFLRRPASLSLSVAPVEPGGELSYVLLLYQLDDTTNYAEYFETRLEVMILEGLEAVWESEPMTVAEISIDTRQEDPTGQWAFLRRNWTVEDGATPPAVADWATVLLGDVNRDGKRDVVVWKQRCVSMSRERYLETEAGADGCRSGFEAAASELGVLLFDAASKALLPLRLDAEAPRPDQALLSRAPGWEFRR